MPPHSSYYDGNYEVIHAVKQGESLSAIAQKYKFKSWQPIWVYNTQKDHMMLNPKGDPDSIAAGQHLFIPRSKDGYDKLLKRLEVLKMGLIASGESQKYQLESIDNEYRAQVVLFDFAGDVATLMGSLAVKALEVTKLRNATVGLEGAQRLAAEIQLNKGMKDLAEAMDAKKLALTAVDGAVGWQANKLDDDDKADYIKKGSTFATNTTPKLIKTVPDYLSKRKLGPRAQKGRRGTSPLPRFRRHGAGLYQGLDARKRVPQAVNRRIG